MVVPCSAASAIRAPISSCRASGSRSAIGSSSSSSSGRLPKARARATRVRWPPERVRILASGVELAAVRDPFGGRRRPSGAGLSSAPSAQGLGDRRAAGTAACPGRRSATRSRASAGVVPEHGHRALGRAAAAGREGEEGGLAGAVGADEGADPAGGQPEGAVAQRPASLPAPVRSCRRPVASCAAAWCMCSLVSLREMLVQDGGEQRGHVLAVQARLAGPRAQSASSARRGESAGRGAQRCAGRTCRGRGGPRPAPRVPARGRPSGRCSG